MFADGFDLDAVIAVCDDGADGQNVVDRLAALVDKSMVTAVAAGGRALYRMLETLRQFGEGRLIDSGELRAREIITRAFHAGCWFASRPGWRRWASPARWMLVAALVSAWVV